GHAGQAAPGAAGARGPKGRGEPKPPDRRTDPDRDEQGSDDGGRGEAVSRRPLLPAQGHGTRGPAASKAERGSAPPGPDAPGGIRRPHEAARGGPVGSG